MIVARTTGFETANNNPDHVIMTFGDRLGSSSVAIDYETAELVEQTDYLAYGQVEGDARFPRWQSLRNPYNFTGKEEDRELGLHYSGARYYNSNLGRWMSPDPRAVHGLSGDQNPYAYVAGRVTSMVDPTGLDGECQGKETACGNTPPPPPPPSGGAPSGGGGNGRSVFSGLGDAIDGTAHDIGSWFKSAPSPAGQAVVTAAKGYGMLMSPLTGKGLADQAVSFVGAGVSLARNPEQWNNGEAGLALAQLAISNTPIGALATPFVQIAPDTATTRFTTGAGTLLAAAVLGKVGMAEVGEPGGLAAGGGGGGTTTFFRGMTYGEALETVEVQGLSAQRIGTNQALNPGAAGSGAYITSQEATAGYYGDLAGLQGRGLGPAVVRIDVPTGQFNAFATRTGISVETPIPRGPFPGATETLIPTQHIGEFNGMCIFCLHR